MPPAGRAVGGGAGVGAVNTVVLRRPADRPNTDWWGSRASGATSLRQTWPRSGRAARRRRRRRGGGARGADPRRRAAGRSSTSRRCGPSARRRAWASASAPVARRPPGPGGSAGDGGRPDQRDPGRHGRAPWPAAAGVHACAPSYGLPRSSTFRSRPSCCGRPARSAAGPRTAATWRSPGGVRLPAVHRHSSRRGADAAPLRDHRRAGPRRLGLMSCANKGG